MIAENVADLISKVTSVEALSASTSLALGGRGTDPGLRQVTLPAAWVMYAQDNVDESPYGHESNSPGMIPSREMLLLTVHVLIYVPYISQEDLLEVQFPLLEQVALAIRGTEAPSCNRWRYLGQKLAFVYPDRIAYEQAYTLTAML